MARQYRSKTLSLQQAKILHSCTHGSHVCLHKIKTVNIPVRTGEGFITSHFYVLEEEKSIPNYWNIANEWLHMNEYMGSTSWARWVIKIRTESNHKLGVQTGVLERKSSSIRSLSRTKIHCMHVFNSQIIYNISFMFFLSLKIFFFLLLL